jgi:hypothetical protein
MQPSARDDTYPDHRSGGREPLLPAPDARRCGTEPLLNGAVGCTLGQHQDEPGAEDISCGQRAGLSDAAEFQLLIFAEHDATAGHTESDVIRTGDVHSATDH